MRLAISLLALALVGASPEGAAPRASGEDGHQLYAVIFEVHASEDGTVQAVRVSKVIDPATGSTEPVAIPVPKAYIHSARAKIAARGHAPDLENGRPKPYFTYFYYDPARPAVVIDKLPK